MSNKLKKTKRKREKNETQLLTNKLKKAIATYLDSRVKKPALQTVDKELSVQEHIVTVLLFFKVSEELILDHGEDLYLDNLSNSPKEELENLITTLTPYIDDPGEKTYSKKVDTIISNQINKKHLLAYLIREIHWIAVSILSASYLSSLILIRSIFELLVGIATNRKGSMSERIESINYLSEDEHKLIKKAWNKLNAWAHPYGKWEKNVCPVFYSHEPMYHPTHYKECISSLTMLTDLFLTIATDKFKISPLEIKFCVEKTGLIIAVNTQGDLPMFLNRIKECNTG